MIDYALFSNDCICFFFLEFDESACFRLQIFLDIIGFIPLSLTKRSVSPESAISVLPSLQLFPIETPHETLSPNNLFTYESERS